MNFITRTTLCAAFCVCFATASNAQEDYAKYDGYNIHNINISSKRIKPEILKKCFPMKEGESFTAKNFEDAQNELHDLRISKKLNFSLTPSQDKKLDIDINADDGYYIFPLAFATGGSKSALGVSVATGNLLKRGETIVFFAGTGKDGTLSSFILKDRKNIYQAAFKNMNFEQRFYDGSWINNSGIFSTTDDEEDFKTPANRLYTKRDAFNILYARQEGDLSVFISPEYEYIKYSKDLPSGNYSAVTFGAKYQNNIRTGTNMGALFGFGLTDKEKSLQNLPEIIFGYGAQLSYTNGGEWTSADFDISKLSAELQSLTEFKNRNILNLQLKAQDSFNSPFAAQVRAEDILSKQGRYSRTLYGERGAGASIAFTHYLVRNNTGLMALQPFYEIAYIYNNGYQHQSGTGATLSYQFWRFPFPLGLNYTYNLSDYSKQITFVFGGKF